MDILFQPKQVPRTPEAGTVIRVDNLAARQPVARPFDSVCLPKRKIPPTAVGERAELPKYRVIHQDASVHDAEVILLLGVRIDTNCSPILDCEILFHIDRNKDGLEHVPSAEGQIVAEVWNLAGNVTKNDEG